MRPFHFKLLRLLQRMRGLHCQRRKSLGILGALGDMMFTALIGIIAPSLNFP